MSNPNTGQPYKRLSKLPQAHPYYHLVGRVASEFALLEGMLDEIIWGLAGVPFEAGACITAQMIGPGPRFRAIATLCQYRDLPKPVWEKVIDRMNKVTPHANERNRYIHDPWVAELTTLESEGDQTETAQYGQFRTMHNFKAATFGFEPLSIDDAVELVRRIQHHQKRVNELRKVIDAALRTRHAERKKQLATEHPDQAQ